MENVKICVVGMGYVGLPLAIAFSEKDFKVIGFDNNSEKIEKYLKLLNPLNFKGRPQISINIHNHSKIIGTENLVYIGSQNFSYGSRNNYEAGVVIKDKEVVEKIFKSFDEIFNNGRYYGSDQVKKIISILYKVEKLEKIFEDYLLFIEITKQLVRANEAREKEAKNFSWDSSKK